MMTIIETYLPCSTMEILLLEQLLDYHACGSIRTRNQDHHGFPSLAPFLGHLAAIDIFGD